MTTTIISIRPLRLPLRLAAARALHNSARLYSQPSTQSGKDEQLSQGIEAASSSPSTPLDAASGNASKQASRDASGDPEGVGFVEQVGSASRSDPLARDVRNGGQEEAMPPGFFTSVKSKLGLGTTTEQAKQNRGGGVGVTGAGTKRRFHESAVSGADPTRGQAPMASRMLKTAVEGEQNLHLKHREEGKLAEGGKGNSAADPTLPSHQMSDDSGKKTASQQQRSFSTSASRQEKETKHTAETYFKDVDETPPAGKTYQVDPSGTGAQVLSANATLSAGEYDTVSKEQPYDTLPSSGPEKDQKLQYGNIPGSGAKEQKNGSGDGASKPDEGPEGASAGGRKPEGRA